MSKSHGCKNIPVATTVWWITLFWCNPIIASALNIVACDYKKCTPGCICDYRLDDQCAKEYGNYGWMVPENADEYVYHHMRRDKPIEYYEIKPAGMRGANKEAARVKGFGRGIGAMLQIDSNALVGQIFFEIHPDHLEKSGSLSVELYGNTVLGLSDCARNGTLLSKSTDSAVVDNMFEWNIFQYENYNTAFRDLSMECHPRSLGAVMAAAEYIIRDPFGETSDRSDIWSPRSGTKGVLNYCVRVTVNTPGPIFSSNSTIEANVPPTTNSKAPAPQEPPGLNGTSLMRTPVESSTKSVDATEEDDTYDTYIDTKIVIEGDRSKVNFGKDLRDGYRNSARMYSNQAIDSKDAHAHKMEVTVNAFLCSDGGTTSGSDVGTIEERGGLYGTVTRKYAIGQVFRICVAPDEDFENDYAVVSFETIVCENEGQSRTLVEEWKYSDPFTDIDVEGLEYVELSSGDTYNVFTDNTLAFSTMVTTGFVQLGDETLTCHGTAELRYDDHGYGRRNLQKDLVKIDRQAVSAEFSAVLDLALPQISTPTTIEEKITKKDSTSARVYLFLASLVILAVVLVAVFLRSAAKGSLPFFNVGR